MKRGRPQPALKEVASMVATIIFQRAGNRVGHGGRAGASKHREEQDTGLESLDAGPAPRRRRVGKNDVVMIASQSWRRGIRDDVHMTSALRGREVVSQILTKVREVA